MKKASILVRKDFYKADHRSQYPSGTTMVYSNFTPRGSRIEGIKDVVFFGLQYYIKEYLINQFNETFFSIPKEKAVSAYKRRLDTSLGKDSVSVNHIQLLHDLQFLPIEIKAVPEGTTIPLRCAMFTIKNTMPEFYWLTNFIETLLSKVWFPCTSATTAKRYYEIFSEYAEKTLGDKSFVQWQGHDFSDRGHTSEESAMLSGMAHLLFFTGTDTIKAIDGLEIYYGADADKELIGGSVAATEHSVMCMGGKTDEFDTYKRLITEVYPAGIVSIVSDTYDLWNVINNYLPRLKNEIMARNGKVVIRPDSGDPVDILCGTESFIGRNRTILETDTWKNKATAEQKGLVELLWDIFGGTINQKGYKVLDSHIGYIYGDSITPQRAEQICQRLEAKGFASTGVFGIGSYTYQYVTRDTFGFAIKATYGEINNVPVEIFKDPKTDDGLKKSAKGLLTLTYDDDLNIKMIDCCTKHGEQNGLLKTVFKNGELIIHQTLAEIRRRVQNIQ